MSFGMDPRSTETPRSSKSIKSQYFRTPMISFREGAWIATENVTNGSVLLEEEATLTCPSDLPALWKKLGKKVAKLESDRKPDDVVDTMPTWSQVTLNEAIIRLLYSFDSSDAAAKESILEMYNPDDVSNDSPFESLIKKARTIVSKEGPKAGISKKTMSSLNEILRILTTKVCVTLEGGAVLFRKLGTVPHSCAPNCMFIPRANNVGQLIAIRAIAEGEVINCSHIPTNCLRSNVETRQAWLRGIAGSRCRSACCTSGYDLRRRVLCAKCHPVEDREALESTADADLCYAARNNATGVWRGLKCDSELEEATAIDLQKEAALIKKILILNEADVDIPRLSQYTRASIKDALKFFGKGHFCYQQLLLLQCGLALHGLCNAASFDETQKAMFASWIRMLDDVVSFSTETELPFAGMDELVRILIGPEVLQMVTKLMAATKKDDAVTLEALYTFVKFAESACACLVLIEGEDSVHSQDCLKLKNWFAKKHRNWLNAPDLPPTPKVTEQSFVSTSAESNVSADATVVGAPKLWSGKMVVPVLLGSAVVVAGMVALYKRRN